MKFRITRHSAHKSPANVLDLLWQRLGPKYDAVSFAKVGGEIKATWRDDASASRTRDERAEIGRRAVYDVVRDVCERAPELKSDWFAVSIDR